MKIVWHIIGLIAMAGVAIGLISGNVYWALKGQGLATSGMRQENPEFWNALQAGASGYLWTAIVSFVISIVLIIVWHILRKKFGLTAWGSMFFVLLYALAVVLLMLLGFNTGMFGLMQLN